MNMKYQIDLGKLQTMQHRARGIPLPNQHRLLHENKTLIDQLVNHSTVIAQLHEQISKITKQRDRAYEEIDRLLRESK
jgi:hypothetical protein